MRLRVNPNASHSGNRKRYVERGIDIDPRWDIFENFLEDMGERPPGTTLDRIDNDKGYSPENCRWATPREQSYNRCNTKFVIYKGETVPLAKLVYEYGVVAGNTVAGRLSRGWDLEKALSTPARKWSRKQ